MPLRPFIAAALLLAVATASAAPLTVEIRGVDGPVLEAVEAMLSLRREQGHELLNAFRIQRLHGRAPDEIRQALRPFGYYRPEIDSELTQKDDGWLARYRIDEGAPVKVRSVDIAIRGEEADLPALREWRKAFPLQAGDILRHEPYERAKGALLQTAEQHGFFAARLTEHRIVVDPQALTADITLHMETGPRYRFGEVSFGELPLREGLIARYAAFQPGEPYQADRLFEFQQHLADSDYFERVDVVPLPDPESHTVPVQVRAAMRKRTRYTLGIGYGTDTGPRGTLGFERRWVNDRGHRLGGDLTTSAIRTEAELRYRIPLDRPVTDYLGFSAGYISEETDTAVRDTALVAVGVTELVDEWTRTVALSYQQETFEVGDEPTDRSTMVVPSITYERTIADDRLFPRQGWRLAGGAKVASEELASTADLVQVYGAAKFVTPLGSGRLLLRGEAGLSQSENFAEVPVSLRFFAGGDYSVRGYAYQSLGPENGDGDVVGGMHLLVGSVEYDQYWNDRFGWAVFIDQGNAFDSTSDFELFQGVGVGLRARLPFGVVRADIAQAVSDPERPWRLHLTIGPEL